MKYKKFALLALAAGMIVGCGEGPSAPNWSAEFKTFVKDNFYGLEVPYFGTSELGSFTYQIHDDYGYVEIFGGELESSEPIKTAAKFLEEKGFVDLLEDYREDPQYAEQVKWTYPMEYRFEAEKVGPRYIRIGLSGKLPTAPAAAAADEVTEEEPAEEPAEEKRSFYAQVFDPYYYSWYDAFSTDLISIAFGEKTGEKSYEEDETIAAELVPYAGQATYQSSGNYIPDLDDAIAEVAENGYLKFWMQDVVRAELDAYAASLKTAEQAWDVYTYEEHELEPGYLGRLYKLVSPSKYFTIDVYFAEGEAALFRVAKAPASIPQVIKDMEPALFESNEVTAYDFEYFEDTESGESGYQYLELSENAAQPSGESLKSAAAAYSALVADEDLNATEVVEFGILSAAEGQGVLDIQDKEVVVYADYKMSSLSTFYFFWGIEVSDWPTYPAELTNEFIAAAGASNIHQFFEQEDGSFKFGTEAESEDDVIAVFNAIKGLEGATVLTEYNQYEDGIGRVALNENTMAVIEFISETETSESGEAQTYYGYYVSLEAIPNFPTQVVTIADALAVSKFNFVEDSEGVWVLPENEEDTTLWADAKTNLDGILEALKAIPGIEFNEPEVSAETAEEYGSYYVAGLLDGKLVVLESVTVGHDESWNGYYSARLTVCDPKEDDPAVTAFMEAVATAAGLEVEFSQIDGNYYFSSDYPEELPEAITTMTEYAQSIVTKLAAACPDVEYATEIVDNDWYVEITITYGDYTILVDIYDMLDYYECYVIEAEASLAEAEA
jgi:hypothetical protein